MSANRKYNRTEQGREILRRRNTRRVWAFSDYIGCVPESLRDTARTRIRELADEFKARQSTTKENA